MSAILTAFVLALFQPAAPSAASPTTSEAATAAFYVSTDNGACWASLDSGLPADAMTRDVVEVNGTLYLTTWKYGLFVLPEGESTWLARSEGLPVNERPELFPTALAANGEHLVLGTFDHGILLSNDAGASWTAPNTNVPDVVGSLLYTADEMLAGLHRGLWHSLDAGANWTQLVHTGGRVNALAEHNGQVFVASQNGIGVLSGETIEWSHLTTNWAIVQLLAQGNYIYAITAKDEVYRSTDGKFWENNILALKGLPAQTLPDALWSGYSPKLGGGEMTPSNIYATSRGWVVGLGGGC